MSSVQLATNGAVEHLRQPGEWNLGLDGKWRPNRRCEHGSQRDRQIVLLRSGGKSIRAIAAEVGCSAGTVHRVLSRWEVGR